MKNNHNNWTKDELKIYLLLLCAKADEVISQEELDMIKSKTTHKNFDEIYEEFLEDDESKSFDKICTAIGHLEYGDMELFELRQEIFELFMADHEFSPREKYLDRILDNIIY